MEYLPPINFQLNFNIKIYLTPEGRVARDFLGRGKRRNKTIKFQRVIRVLLAIKTEFTLYRVHHS